MKAVRSAGLCCLCASLAAAAALAAASAGPVVDPGLWTRAVPPPGTSRPATPGLATPSDPGWVLCQVEMSAAVTDPARLQSWLADEIPSARYEGHWRRWVQVSCPATDAARLEDLPGAAVLARPPAPVLLARTESQGADVLGAPIYWSLGHDGRGVRVAVIDVGFTGYGQLLGSDLPPSVKTKSFYGSPSGSGDLSGAGQSHGTGVAEIVYDVAPGAELLLTNVSTAVELANAVEWARDEGVDVINHSVGWFFGPGDGTGEIAAIARAATAAGVVWVNAAGNFAEAHWEGAFLDTDADDLLEFPTGAEELRLEPQATAATIVLSWNRWPLSTDLAFDVEVWVGGQLAASSETVFEGYPYAFRSVGWERGGATGDAGIRIRRTGGDVSVQEGLRLELFRLDGGPFPEAYRTASGSLVLPADVPDVVAVGAVHWEAGTLEPFSSRGPTSRGVPKPEILSFDGVANRTFGTFWGTSAAAPHVAGAVALLQSAAPRGGMAQPRWTVAETRTFLERSAEEPDFPKGDAVVWGIASLPSDPFDIEPVLVLHPNPARGRDLTVHFHLRSSGRSLEPFTKASAGLLIARLVDAGGRTVWKGSVPAAGIENGIRIDPAPAAGTYWLSLTGAGVRAAGRWVLLGGGKR